MATHSPQTGTVGTSNSFSVNIGTAASDRYVILAITSRLDEGGADDITAITLGGISCTKIVGTASQNGIRSELWITNSPVTTGTTATCAITRTVGDPWHVYVCPTAIQGYNLTPTSSNQTTAAPVVTSIGISATVPTGGVVIIAAGHGDQTVAGSWTNATSQDTDNCTSFRGLGAYSTTAGTATRTLTASGGEFFTIAYVAFEPETTTINSTGAPASGAADVDGTVGVTVNATGTPASQAADVDGVVGVTVNVTGALTSQAATVAGAANQTLFTGTPTAQAAVVAGTVGITANFTGTLSVAAATVGGTVGVTINLNGTLASQAASLAGEGTTDSDIVVTGTLQAQNAVVSGIASATINATGAIQAQNGAFTATFSGFLPTITFTSAMQSGVAAISGVYSRVKIDRSDVVRHIDHGRFRFKVRVR